jgi:RHS repeat-associated protein
VSYSYDADGNKTAMSDASGSSSFIYDPFGELTSAENGASQTVGYGYNADGEVTGITYPLPGTANWATTDTVGYGYDNADLLTSVTDFNNKTISISNTADGLQYSETLGSSGDSIATTYDATDSPSAIDLVSGSTTLLGFSYSEAPSGAILAETDTPSSPQSPADYTYDSQSRVTSMTPGSGSTLNYGFDASSNLTTLPPGATGTYDHAGELTSSVLSGTTTSYTYNADGERLSAKQGSTTIASGTWNGAGELTSYSNTAANMSSATYDGDSLRTSETSTPSGGSQITQNFVWNTISAVPNLLMDSTNAYIFAGSGTPAEQVNLSTGTIVYLVADSLGSVRGAVASSGSLSGSVDYDAWGNPETAGGLSSYTPFGFAGAYTDLSGIVYLIGRYYDPQTGQFLSVDPDVQQTLEAYEYVNGDPVNDTDALGLGCGWNPFCYVAQAYGAINNAVHAAVGWLERSANVAVCVVFTTPSAIIGFLRSQAGCPPIRNSQGASGILMPGTVNPRNLQRMGEEFLNKLRLPPEEIKDLNSTIGKRYGPWEIFRDRSNGDLYVGPRGRVQPDAEYEPIGIRVARDGKSFEYAFPKDFPEIEDGG